MENKEESFEWPVKFCKEFGFLDDENGAYDDLYERLYQFIQKAIVAALQSRDKEVVREIEVVQEYYGESNDTAWNALERLKDRLSSQKEI